MPTYKKLFCHNDSFGISRSASLAKVNLGIKVTINKPRIVDFEKILSNLPNFVIIGFPP
jgi:hypothetical protein